MAKPSEQEDDGLESVLNDEDDEFQEAALFVQNHLPLFSRDDLLYLYARFKQVRNGLVSGGIRLSFLSGHRWRCQHTSTRLFQFRGENQMVIVDENDADRCERRIDVGMPGTP